MLFQSVSCMIEALMQFSLIIINNFVKTKCSANCFQQCSWTYLPPLTKSFSTGRCDHKFMKISNPMANF